ncbi:hypothetical protein C9374_007378 [Naegleria lovaniensis]|uniref:YDG domain-containing protein n=1 Tax=Naegleria lovaniensis TaxID=51637 RepID=A0AA88GH03_NAELO|nr:uncharacterized protein C9374_007378 [Naegleria lovaniensis]KAG2379239.1 hypothetical protein C9374_007378 [Naegleria lovaniensis]
MTPQETSNSNNTSTPPNNNSNGGYIDYDDMFIDAGRAANYSEQYSASSSAHQRLKAASSSADMSKKLENSVSTPTTVSSDSPLNPSSTLNKSTQSICSSPQSLPNTPSIATVPSLKSSSNFNISFIDQDNSKQESTKQQPLGGNSLTPTSSFQIKDSSSQVLSSTTLPSGSSSCNVPLLPNLQSIVNSSPLNSHPQKTIPTLSSPGVTGVHYKDRKRTISLQYLAEISNFSRNDVQDAMICKIDNETGEIYGNIPDIVVGMKFESRMDLLDCKLHTDLQSAVCTNSNYSKPAASLIIYDSQDEHEDRGTIVLYSINFQQHDPQSSPPSIKGTAAEALAQNSAYKIPVRVIRGRYELSIIDRESPLRNHHCPVHGYRYDGLYFVGEYFFEPTISSYIFKLIRIYGQPELPHTSIPGETPSFSSIPPQFTNHTPIPQQPTPSSTSGAVWPRSNIETSVFGIPSLVTQRMISSSSPQQQHTYSKQSSHNYHDLPYIPKLPSNIPSPNSQHFPQNHHALPSIPSIPSIASRTQFYGNDPSTLVNRPVSPTMINSNTSSVNATTRSGTQNQFYNISNKVEDGHDTERMMNLTHSTIRQMISNLRSQNSKFNERIQQYSANITDINSKVEDVQRCLPPGGTSSRQLTSRNKTFTWKAGVDRSKYFVYDDEDGEDQAEEEQPTRTDQQEHKKSKKRKKQSVSASSSSTSVDQSSDNNK